MLVCMDLAIMAFRQKGTDPLFCLFAHIFRELSATAGLPFPTGLYTVNFRVNLVSITMCEAVCATPLTMLIRVNSALSSLNVEVTR